jgi:alcohol dehydrogenase class IV
MVDERSLAYTHGGLPGRVVFGAGSRHQVPAEADTIGAERILVVAGRSASPTVAELEPLLGSRLVGRHEDVVQHVPVDRAAAAVATARRLAADTVLAIGGGSAIGFGKAIALELDVHRLAMPTTYAGSEMTAIWGMTDGDGKRTGSDPRVRPEIVIYDAELTLTMPPSVAGPSGMNALAHAVEALYGPGANPMTAVLAAEAIRILHLTLPLVCREPEELGARNAALHGAHLAGVALAMGGTALHHKTCHVLGGMFGLDHGEMNAVLLGHAVAYNAPAIAGPLARMAGALGVAGDEVPGALHDLARSIGAPTSLEAIGMPADGIDEATRRVVSATAANVRPPESEGIRRMLEDAFRGRRPAQ